VTDSERVMAAGVDMGAHSTKTIEASVGPQRWHWVPIALLLISLAVTAYGLLHRHFIFEHVWTRGDLLRLGLFGGVVIITAVPVFLWLRRLSRLVAVVAAGAVLVVAAGPLSAGAVGLIFVSALSVGDPVVRRIPRTSRRPLLGAALSTAVGLAVIAAVVGVLAHLPVNRWWLYLPLLALPLIVNARRMRYYLDAVLNWLRRGGEETRLSYAAGVLVLLVLGLHIVRVVQPGIDWDGLAMHEMVAGTMRFDGSWNFDFNANTWALWPMAADWLLSTGWILGGEVAARLVNFASFVLLLGLLHTLIGQTCGSQVSRLLVAVLASSSLTFGLTQNMFAEVTLGLFTLGAFAVLASVDDHPGWPWALAAGLLLGGCLLTKASAGLVAVPLALALAGVSWRRSGLSQGSVLLVVAGAGTVAIGLSAYLYAYLKTGNPVFPLYNGIFQSPYAPAMSNLDDRWTGHFSWMLPYKVTFATSAYIEGGDGGLGFQYLLLFPAGLATAVLLRMKTVLLAAAVSIASGLLVLVSVQYVRYLFPALLLAMVVGAAAYVRPVSATPKTTRTWLLVVAFALIPLNLFFMPTAVYGWSGFRLEGLFSREARQELVAQQAPWWTLNELVNERAGASARVAYLGRMAGAGLEGTPVYAVEWNPTFLCALDSAQTPEDVMAVFQETDVDYVIADPYGGQPPISSRPAVQAALARHATLVAEVNGAILYQLDR